MDNYNQNSNKMDDAKKEKRKLNVKICREKKKAEFIQKEQQLRSLQIENSNLVRTIQWQYSRQTEIMNHLKEKYRQNPQSFSTEETRFIFQS
jgi:hypothetical protein